MPERPTGVTILAIIFIIFSLLQIIGGASLLAFGGSMIGIIGTGLPEEASGFYGFLSGIFTIIAIGAIVFGIIGLVVGAGLLGGREWARIIALVLSVLSIIMGLITIFAGGIVSIIIGAIVVWYLTRPHVVSYFKGVEESG